MSGEEQGGQSARNGGERYEKEFEENDGRMRMTCLAGCLAKQWIRKDRKITRIKEE